MLLTNLDLEEFTRELAEDLKNPETLEEIMKEVAKEIPSVIKPLIEERDMYLSSSLYQCALKAPCVVAVVGLGHLEGIKKYWGEPVDRRALLSLPPPRSLLQRRLFTFVFWGSLFSLVGYCVFRIVSFFRPRE